MEKRIFGKTGVPVSVVGFGGGGISGEGGGYGFGAITEDDACSLVIRALEAGINLFDTAPIYGFGESERRLGKALKGRRDKAVIVSKSGVTWDANKRVDMTNDPKVVTRMLEQSLKDLQTDYIDLYMVHWPDQRFDIRKPLEVYAEAIEAGKIRWVGLSNTNPEDIAKAEEIVPIAVAQGEFNLFRSGIKSDLFPTLKEKKIGFMSWGTLDKGILSGTVTADRKFDSFDARSRAPWWKQQDLKGKLAIVEKLKGLCADAGIQLRDLALAFVTQPEVVATALVGFKSPEQMETAIESSLTKVPTDVLEEAERIARG